MNHRPTTEGEQLGSLSWSIVLNLPELGHLEAVSEALYIADRVRAGAEVTVRVGDSHPTSYDARVVWGLIDARARGVSIKIEASAHTVGSWWRALNVQPEPPARHLQLVTT